MNQMIELLQSQKPLIMGVLNVTPDSFSDGGKFLNVKNAVKHAKKMIADGADFLDVGAESSAPYSPEVPLEEEWERLRDILPMLTQNQIPFSVDTWKAEIARRSIAAGAQMINDVTGLRGDREMAAVLSEYPDILVCIMYSKEASARTTLSDLQEPDIVATISDFLAKRIEFAEKNGIQKNRIILDPGMGAFLSSDPGKSFEVLRRLAEFQKFGCPLLVGTSRKGFLKEVSAAKNPKDRVIASVISSLIALQNGARIVRMHDVQEMKEALETWRLTTEI